LPRAAPPDVFNEVAELTRLLQAGEDPLWVRLCSLFAGRGIDVRSAALATSFEDGEDFEFGLLVLRDGRTIQYGLARRERADGEEIVEWAENRASRSAFTREVAAARESSSDMNSRSECAPQV